MKYEFNDTVSPWYIQYMEYKKMERHKFDIVDTFVNVVNIGASCRYGQMVVSAKQWL